MEEEFIESDYTKDDSYKTLQTINTWISNIDTKVSFTLAFIGVISTLILNQNNRMRWKEYVKYQS